MRILFLTEYFPPETNAVATRVFERARYWRRAGHEVTVVTTCPNFPQGKVYPGYANSWYRVESKDGIRIVRVKTFIHPNKGRLFRILDQLSFVPGGVISAVLQSRHDVVVATSPTLFAGIAARVAAFIRRAPFVLEIGDLGAASIGAVGAVRSRTLLRAVRVMEWFLYRGARRVIVQTGAMKREVAAAGMPEARIETISNGADVCRFSGIDGEAGKTAGKRRFVVQYVGTMGMSHALNYVLQAADRLRERDDIRFVLTGDGALRPALEEMAHKRRLDNVYFEGPYPYERMPEIWASADLALVSLRDHPTFQTVVPSKIFEAMAAGVPVLLAAPSGEATELVRRHGVGTIIEPENAPVLVEAVSQLADSPERLARQSDNARAAAVQYDRGPQAERYLAVLADVTKSR